jgi:hypothetical protein
MSSTVRSWPLLLGVLFCRRRDDAGARGRQVEGRPRRAVERGRDGGVLGLGSVIDFNEDDVQVTAGAGLRAQLSRWLFMFGEVRMHRILGIPVDDPRTILPLTLGLGVGPKITKERA